MKFPSLTPEYSELKALTEPWNIAYGPFLSRRYGKSLGVNLLGSHEKVCSFNCPYCELGPTQLRMKEIKTKVHFPSLEQIDHEVRELARNFTASGETAGALSIVGNGEPTFYPQFDEAAEIVMRIRDELLPEVPVICMSNGTNLDSRKVIDGLNKLDERIIKVDAGNDSIVKKINAPLVRFSVDNLIYTIKQLDNFIAQSMFVQGAVDNTKEEHIEDWLEVMGLIKPKAIQIYTLERVPHVAGLKAATEESIYRIAQIAKKALKIEVRVYS